MLCKKCCKEIQEDTKFCPNCGTKVEKKEETLEDILSGNVETAAGSLNAIAGNMKFCSHCGKQILKDAVMCPHCGCAIESKISVTDEPNKGLNILSFLLPIVGAILYLVYNEKEPKKAAAIGKWALCGLGIVVICNILFSYASEKEREEEFEKKAGWIKRGGLPILPILVDVS